MWSLALDALVVLVARANLNPSQAQTGAIVCALLTLPFLSQDRIARGMASLQTSSRNPSRRTQQLFSALLVVIIGLLIASKLLAFSRFDNLLGIAFTAVLVIGIASSIRSVLAQRQSQAQALTQAPWEYIPLWERQMIVTATIPMVTARLVSLLAAASADHGEVSTLIIGAFCTSVVLLLILKPNRATYVGHCLKCKTPAPIAFVQFGSCPVCDGELAQHLR